jgi:hypothetical protein
VKSSPSAKKNPAKSQKANRLPKSDRRKAEETRHEPVPQMENSLPKSSDYDEQEYCNSERYDNPA